MAGLRTLLALGLALAVGLPLVGCEGVEPSGRDEALAATREAKPEAEEHPDARFLVTYAGAPFRVHVRYVPLIDESVVAIQQGAGEARSEGWPTIDATARGPLPGNFADDAYEDVAVGIARTVQGRGGICPGGRSLDMATDAGGDVRTLYRRNRQVWVVFALCPGQAAGATG